MTMLLASSLSLKWLSIFSPLSLENVWHGEVRQQDGSVFSFRQKRDDRYGMRSSISVIKAIRKTRYNFYWPACRAAVWCAVWGIWGPPVRAAFWHAGFHYSLWMWLQSPTADGGEGGGSEEKMPTAFHHNLYSCQRPKNAPTLLSR